MPKPKSSKKRNAANRNGFTPNILDQLSGPTPMELDLERTTETADLFSAVASPPPPPPPPPPPNESDANTPNILIALDDEIDFLLAVEGVKIPRKRVMVLLSQLIQKRLDIFEDLFTRVPQLVGRLQTCFGNTTTNASTQTLPPLPPPIPPLKKSVAVQTLPPPPPPPPPPITNNVAVQTLQPPKRTYAEAVTQTVPHSSEASTQSLPAPSTVSTDLSAKGSPSCSPANDSPEQTGTRTKSVYPHIHTRAIVLHGIPTNMHLPSLEEGIEVGLEQITVGSRWLLSSSRRAGKRASSVVVYFLETHTVPSFLIISGRRHRVEDYEWDRPCKV